MPFYVVSFGKMQYFWFHFSVNFENLPKIIPKILQDL